MRLRDPSLLLILIATALPACSRLTFIKPNYSKSSYEPTHEPVTVRDSEAVKQRLAAHDRIALASGRLQEGDLDAAEREARAALKQDPRSVDANTLLAAVAGQRGNAEAAGRHYRQAAELAPDNGPVLNNYGAWLCANDQAAASLAWFDRAIAAPGYTRKASALANAGACANRVGQPERAERDLRQALTLEPDNAVALAAMAELAYAHGQYMDARAFSQRRLAAAPASPTLLQLASQIENKLGDRAAADRYVRRLKQEFPEAGAVDAVETRRP